MLCVFQIVSQITPFGRKFFSYNTELTERKIFFPPLPKEAYYLELGLIPIGEIIKARRIQYLHHLVTRNDSEMLHQFFIAQWTSPTRGDWTETMKENLEEFEIPAEFEFMKSKSKDSFKNQV